MKKGTLFPLAVLGLLIVAAAGAWIGLRQPEAGAHHADVVKALSGLDAIDPFERATQARTFVFPDDFGPHPGYQTEWWYYTGNLKSENNHHFGYQLTIFRRALNADMLPGTSKWRTNQIYFAHFAVTDVQQGRFHAFERFSRGALGLAGAQGNPYQVWIEDWRVSQQGDDYVISAAQENVTLQLRLRSVKPIVFQGDRGLSRKGQEIGNASYYFSQTRLATQGSIRIGSNQSQVTGYSWLDKEWSTSALERGDTGWDWFAIQLDDNRELMVFQIRSQSGGINPFSSGSYVDQAGAKTPLTKDQFSITPTATWKSPHTGTTYPSAWLIEVPSLQLSLTLTPYLNEQEHRHSFNYWEGAVRVTSDAANGNGYVELTGY